MPIYQYKCPKGHVFDKRLEFKESQSASCTRCGLMAAKQITAPNFTFGWTRWEDGSIPRNNDPLVRDI